MKPCITSYRNEPILVLNPGAKYLFQFGGSKAQMILDNIEAIKEFVASGGLNCSPSDNMEAEPLEPTHVNSETFEHGGRDYPVQDYPVQDYSVAKPISGKEWLAGKVSV